MENNQFKPIEDRCEIVLYQPDDNVRLEVRLQVDTVWLTQQQMTELFKTTKQNVSLHINNIFREGELTQNSVVKESLTTAGDGKSDIMGLAHRGLIDEFSFNKVKRGYVRSDKFEEAVKPFMK